jgi:hypothetical protein
MTLKQTLFERFFKEEITRSISLAVRAVDDSRDRQVSPRFGFSPQAPAGRDRYDHEREEILRQALEAWRVNPLARRIVELTSQYVVGGGISVESRHAASQEFLQEFWQERLNRMDSRVAEWSDELCRSGELFILVSTDAGGMSYVRAVPALEIVEIETSENDIEQELRFTTRGERCYAGLAAGLHSQAEEVAPSEKDAAGMEHVMMHYAVNRPAGALRGESDLAPLLRWLSRYAAWLEDRARLNHFRNIFQFVVTMHGSSEADRRRRQAELNLNPPDPGSILVKDQSESWEVLSPKLESTDAGEDGLSLKKMIAAGAGFPLHYLAEPESSTRTTAESAGGPSFRRMEQRQEFFTWMISDLLKVILTRARQCGRPVDPQTRIVVKGADLSARDNTSLAQAAGQIITAFSLLHEKGLIEDAELLRLAYRFAGEVVEVDEILKNAGRANKKV